MNPPAPCPRTSEVLRLPRHRALAFAAVAAAVLSSALSSACAGPDATPVYGPPPTVEQLAARAGCTPKMQIDAAELRQGHCHTPIGDFFLTTFATQRGKDEWMDQAPEYSPHLVGDIWTALAPRDVLDRLRLRIGGDLHLKDHRVKSPG